MNADGRFPGMLHFVPFLPILVAALAYAARDAANDNPIWLLTAIVYVAVISTYVSQVRYLKHQMGHNVKSQLVLLAAGTLVPFLAILLGDARGVVEFGMSADPGTRLSEMVYPGLLIGLSVLQIFAVGNVITIAAPRLARALTTFAKIVHGILWIVIVLLSLLFHSTAYSLRDPNTE